MVRVGGVFRPVGAVWRATSESLWDQKPPFTPVIRLKRTSGSWGKWF